MRPFPKFSKLVEAYPNKNFMPAKALLDRIGGQVRARVHNSDNTCTVRLSDAFNRGGDPIRKVHGVHEWQGKTARDRFHAVTADRYILRVADMKTYLERQYGPGKLIYDAMDDPRKLLIPGPTQGIIVLVWKGVRAAFGATGHVDLFRVFPVPGNPPRLIPACTGDCHWYTIGGPMTGFLWEMRP